MQIPANWPAPRHVHAVTTTRVGGFSSPPYDSLNLAQHVGDADDKVEKNRQKLVDDLSLPALPVWLNQVHGNAVVEAKPENISSEADGSFSQRPGQVCAVLTADCLPVFFCDAEGQEIALAHAGWRGLHAGVIDSCIEKFTAPAEDIMAWLGPAIGPLAFEVGPDVYDAFTSEDSNAAVCFKPVSADKWLADIYALATLALERCGVMSISGGDYCTYSDAQQFYSYRRDGQCGRMASLIWMDESGK